MKSTKRRILLTGLTLLAMASAASAAVLAEFNAALAGAGTLPEDVDPAWIFKGDGPLMTNNGVFLLQDYETPNYGNWTMNSLPAGTINVGVKDYGISVTMRPLTDIPYSGSTFANIFLEWQDEAAYYGMTFWKGGGAITYGPSGAGLIGGIDWDVPHTFFVGYNSGADTFSFFLDGVLRTTQPRTQFILGTNFTGPNQVVFGDAVQGTAASAAEWYSIAIYDTAAPIPEPAAFLLAGLGGILVWAGRHRKLKA